ncbi:hypothetical protein VZT92_019181 [Zoarces viviparus]|uniref:Uncharacterized protein n=1 Tax=Zoarces viviparus TaxID=48416 RepID=A0AAW1ELL0_ZOAVI
MARWAQYYSRGSYAANLEQRKRKRKGRRGMLSVLSRMIRGQSSMAVFAKPAAAGSGLEGVLTQDLMGKECLHHSCLPLRSVC